MPRIIGVCVRRRSSLGRVGKYERPDECSLETRFVDDVAENVVLSARQGGQRRSKHRVQRAVRGERMEVGKPASIVRAHQKEMHQLAVLGHER